MTTELHGDLELYKTYVRLFDSTKYCDVELARAMDPETPIEDMEDFIRIAKVYSANARSLAEVLVAEFEIAEAVYAMEESDDVPSVEETDQPDMFGWLEDSYDEESSP